MVNIVLTTRNRYKLLEQTLSSLYHNTPRDLFNLTVVDDGSDDFRCTRLLSEYAQNSNCVIITVQNSGHNLSKLKKIGVGASWITFGEGDYLYLSDNDVYFMPTWLEQLTLLAETSFLQGFRLWGAQNHPYHQPVSNLPNGLEFASLAGTSWLMHFSTWDHFSPFLKSCGSGVCQSEDTVFCKALTDAGLRIAALSVPLVIDCGWTNSEGKPSPGYELRKAVPGVYHE